MILYEVKCNICQRTFAHHWQFPRLANIVNTDKLDGFTGLKGSESHISSPVVTIEPAYKAHLIRKMELQYKILE